MVRVGGHEVRSADVAYFFGGAILGQFFYVVVAGLLLLLVATGGYAGAVLALPVGFALLYGTGLGLGKYKMVPWAFVIGAAAVPAFSVLRLGSLSVLGSSVVFVMAALLIGSAGALVYGYRRGLRSVQDPAAGGHIEQALPADAPRVD